MASVNVDKMSLKELVDLEARVAAEKGGPLEDAERAAEKLRDVWRLGDDAIENLTELLEVQGRSSNRSCQIIQRYAKGAADQD